MNTIGIERAPAPKPAPVIDGKISQIESRISHLFETSSRIKQAINRLTNPGPEEIGKDADKHSGSSVETRLQVIIDQLDVLGAQSDVIANRLDASV